MHHPVNIKNIWHRWAALITLIIVSNVLLLFFGHLKSSNTEIAYICELLSFITSLTVIVGGFNMFRIPFIKKKLQHKVPTRTDYLYTWCTLRNILQAAISLCCLAAAILSLSESCIWCSLCVAIAQSMCQPSRNDYKSYIVSHLNSSK